MNAGACWRGPAVTPKEPTRGWWQVIAVACDDFGFFSSISHPGIGFPSLSGGKGRQVIRAGALEETKTAFHPGLRGP